MRLSTFSALRRDLEHKWFTVHKKMTYCALPCINQMTCHALTKWLTVHQPNDLPCINQMTYCASTKWLTVHPPNDLLCLIQMTYRASTKWLTVYQLNDLPCINQMTFLQSEIYLTTSLSGKHLTSYPPEDQTNWSTTTWSPDQPTTSPLDYMEVQPFDHLLPMYLTIGPLV